MSAPIDPIGVSAPGALSQRTDIQPLRAPTGMAYGEAGALLDAQRAAPLAATPAPNPVSVTGLDAPTASPDQPITAGAALGAGPGPEALSTAPAGSPAAGGAISRAIARAAANDPTGELSQLLVIAQQKGY